MNPKGRDCDAERKILYPRLTFTLVIEKRIIIIVTFTCRVLFPASILN